jgi:hypothetical protein
MDGNSSPLREPSGDAQFVRKVLIMAGVVALTACNPRQRKERVPRVRRA